MSRRWQPYPAYKESGVKWLGRIPVTWKRSKVKYLASYLNGVAFKPSDWSKNGRRIIRIQNLTDCSADYNRYSGQLDRRYLVHEGDVLISWSASLGVHVWNEREPAWLNQHIFKATPNEEIVAKSFFVCLAQWFVLEMEKETHGSTMQHLTRDKFGRFRVYLPPLTEQRAIAGFLDRETEKIDKLIRKQERLIELLEEKRAALISHAVTKGLDPDVAMKESRIPWLGAIPRHWDLAPLKHFVAQTPDAVKTGPFGSQLLSSEMNGSAIKVYNQRNVIDRDLSGGDKYITEEKHKELEAFTVFPGDVLVTTRGTIGQCVTVPEDAELGVLHPCLMRIDIDQDALLSEYLIYLIQDSYLVQTQLYLMSNATTIEVIYSGDLRQVVVPRPPIDEQVAIIDCLNRETDTLDSLIEKVQDMTGRLQEYRTALISAAVTGKIDVRGEVPPSSLAQEESSYERHQAVSN